MSFLSDNILTILLASIILLIYIKVKKTFSYFNDKGLPQVNQSWIDLLKTLSPSALNNMCNEMYTRTNGGDAPYVGFFHSLIRPTILIRDPALCESILIKDFSYFQDHGIDFNIESNPLAGHLFNMKGDEWRTLRHKLVPTFTSAKLRGMVPIMEECADKLIEEMNQDPSLKTDVNLKNLFKKYSLSVIASTAFGIDPGSVKDPNCQFVKVLQQFLNLSIWSQIKFIFYLLCPSIAKLFTIKFFPKEGEDFIFSLTKQTLEMRKKTGVKRNDFIQLLLELKEKGSVELDVKDLEQDEKDNIANMQTEPTSTKLEFTDEFLAAQVLSFLFGGFENIAYLITISNYMLRKHPHIQTRVREEVKQLKEKHGGLDYQAVSDMKLLGACIDEALRLYPPVSVILRESNKPYTFSDGKKIDKGVSIQLPGKSLQRDSKYWTDPDEFKPDRFLDKGGIVPGSYMPFGDGPRICIAQRMALLVTKLMLAKLVLIYELLPSPKTKEPINLVILFGADNEGGFYSSFKDLNN